MKFAKVFDAHGEQLLVRIISLKHSPDCRCGFDVTFSLTFAIFGLMNDSITDIGFVIHFDEWEPTSRALERFDARLASMTVTVLQQLQHHEMKPEEMKEYCDYLRFQLTDAEPIS